MPIIIVNIIIVSNILLMNYLLSLLPCINKKEEKVETPLNIIDKLVYNYVQNKYPDNYMNNISDSELFYIYDDIITYRNKIKLMLDLQKIETNKY